MASSVLNKDRDDDLIDDRIPYYELIDDPDPIPIPYYEDEEILRKLQTTAGNSNAGKKVYRGRIILVGAFHAGKSSTKRSLFNEAYEERHISTEGADIYGIDITEWIIKDSGNDEYHSQRSIAKTKTLLESAVLSEVKRMTTEISTEQDQETANQVLLKEDLKEEGEDDRQLSNRLLQRLENVQDVNTPDFDFSLWDFAGQNVYYMTHQVFLTSRVVYILVTDLTKSLDDIVSTPVRMSDMAKGQLAVEWKVKDFLCYWMNSIHTHATPTTTAKGRGTEGPTPPVIIVGTKKDLLAKKCRICSCLCGQRLNIEEEAEKRLKDIKEYLTKNVPAASKHIVDMVAVDNKSRKKGKASDGGVRSLQSLIKKMAVEQFFLDDVPVKWLQLELFLRKEKKPTIQLSEVYAIGKKLNIDEGEVDKALAFFHSVGEMLHFRAIPEIKDTIILDMGWLVDLFSILITHNRNVPPWLERITDELYHHGRLHEELVNYLLEEKNRLSDKEVLLKTMEQYDILCPMPTEADGENRSKYYLPWLLKRSDDQNGDNIYPLESKQSSPIYFHFKGNFLPEGLYYRLVVRCLKRWPKSTELRRHRVRIVVKSKEDLHITLCKEGSDIQLRGLTIIAEQMLSLSLTQCRMVVEEALRDIINNFYPGLSNQMKLSIKCSCNGHTLGELLPGADDTDDLCVPIDTNEITETGDIRVYCHKSVQNFDRKEETEWLDISCTQGNTIKDGHESLTRSPKPKRMGDLNDQTDSNAGSTGEQQAFSQSMKRNTAMLAINDEWATQKGGISTIHRQVVRLALETGHIVYATALTANEVDKADARAKMVKLLLPTSAGSNERPSLDWLNEDHENHFPEVKDIKDVKLIIGHLPITSTAALRIRDKTLPTTKVIQFNHTIPEDTEVYKDTGTPLTVEQKETILCQAAERSDVVFSVGPRMFSHFENKYRKIAKDVWHELFLPMPDDKFFQVRMKEPTPECKVEILTFGRVVGVSNLKGYDIVATALSKVVEFRKKNMPSNDPPVWTIRGIPENEKTASDEFIKKHITTGHLKYNLRVYGTQDQICSDLQQSHLCLMPSRSEPYGMVGLEAIAAGIPVLVTINSGLARFLSDYFPDISREMIVDVGVNDVELEKDIKTWEDSIHRVLLDYDNWFRRAQEMKKHLKDCKAIKDNHELFKRICCE